MRNIREFTTSVGGSVIENVGRAIGRAQEHTPLPVDLLEGDDAYLALFDAPDAQSSDVQVRLNGRTVEVRIDRFREYRDDYEMRFPGRGLTLDGHVTLPAEASIDGEAASATLHENGTLHVHIPKDTEGTTVDVTDESSESISTKDESTASDGEDAPTESEARSDNATDK